MSTKNSIHHISPIDGRYSSKTDSISKFFSEFALIKSRVEVEIEYLIQLASLNLKGFKKFQDADYIRDKLNDMNIELIDHKGKTIWMKKEKIQKDC